MAAIGTIRNKMGGILIVVLVIAMISFLMMDMTSGAGQNRSQGVTEIATVNGQAISMVEFNQRLDQNITNYKSQLQKASISDLERNDIRQSTYDEMITEKINQSKYNNLGVKISDAEYASLLNAGKMQHPTIKSSFVNEAGVFDEAVMSNYLSTLDADEPGTEPGTKRRSWANFERYMLNERLTKKYNSLINSGLNVPTWMAEATYAQQNTPVNFEYVYLPYRDISDSTISVSDNELKQYISEHANEYKRDESVDIKFVTYPIVASPADFTEASNWIDTKVGEWKGEYAEKDSLFLKLYSDVPFTSSYYKQDELTNVASDSLFNVPVGTLLGPYKEGTSYTAYKLMDKKMIPDSLQARHLLLGYDAMKTQEDLLSAQTIIDSLLDLVNNQGVALSSLTANFSTDITNNTNGGDLGWVKPNQMVPPFNNAIFFEMKQGDVIRVNTEFGLHLVEVYNAKPTSSAVKIAALQRNVYPSDITQRDIYAEASSFAGNYRTRESFESAEGANILDAQNISKDQFSVQKIQGNAREIIKWAFKADEGEVSPPFSIGDSYVIAMVNEKNAEGISSVEDVRLFVEAEVIKEKKAAMLAEKLNGNDLASIAASAGKTAATANTLSFDNPSIPGVGNEPQVVGAALGLDVNEVSKPIKGATGVFVVKTTSKVDAPASTNLDFLKTTLKQSMTTSLNAKLGQATKEAADIEDNRFDAF